MNGRLWMVMPLVERLACCINAAKLDICGIYGFKVEEVKDLILD